MRGSSYRPLSSALLLAMAACGPAASDAGPNSSSGDPVPASTLVESLPRTPTGALLSRSLLHHDPNDRWSTRAVRLEWASIRPTGEERITALAIDNPAEWFELHQEYRGADMQLVVERERPTARVDGSTDITTETRELLQLDREGGLFWRNYYLFLVGLPMKLTDPGTTLAEAPTQTTFDGREVEAVHVTYETEDSYPNWEFYFDPGSAALVGARFWREGRDLDGEYIVMSGSVEAGGLRLPASRAWHMNADDEYLGTDEVRALEVTATAR